MDTAQAEQLIQTMQLTTFKNGVKLTALMQATLEQMDTMKHTKMYRHKLKSMMKALESELEKTVLKPLQSLDSTDEEMVTRLQSNIELILDMSVEEIAGLKIAVEEHREAEPNK